ncbi:UvrD-helicase domain-containing protein [bacterium]|nr:UvrD-helicase domain-containing protein [bacterium]
MLKQEIEVLDYSRDFVIVDGEDQLNITKKIIEDHNLSLPLFLSPKKILEVIELIKLTDVDVSKGYSELYNKTNIVDANQIDLVLKVYFYYCDYLKKNNMLDFNDLINFVCQIFERYPTIVKK